MFIDQIYYLIYCFKCQINSKYIKTKYANMGPVCKDIELSDRNLIIGLDI